MVSIYFGLPGCGKTTLIAKHAYEYKKAGYNVYCNVKLRIDGIIYIDKKDLGTFNIHDGKVLIDEATLVYDSRDFKKFEYKDKYFNLMHRHYKVDIEYFTQKYDGLDAKIRNIADSVFWVRKGVIFRGRSKAIRVPYGVYIPEKGDTNNVGEILNGYYKPSILDRIFAERCIRRKYYKYFDSFEHEHLPSLPLSRQVKLWHCKKVKGLKFSLTT